MRQLRLIAYLLVVATVVATAVACRSSSDKAGGSAHAPALVLSLASPGGMPPTPVSAWIAAVERRSHGAVRIVLRQQWRRGDPLGEQHTVRDLRTGRVELAWVGARIFDRFGVRSFQPLLAPFLVDSYELERRVFADPLVQRTISRAALPGISVLGVLPGPMRRMVGFAHPFMEPKDFRGRIVGLQDSTLAAATLRALGAVPRPAAGAVAQVRGLDGYEQQLVAIHGNFFDISGKYVTVNVDLWPRPLVFVAGAKALARLTAAQRSLLRDTARDVYRTSFQQASAEDAAATVDICRTQMRQVTATARQLERLRAAVAPIYRALETDPVTRAATVRIESLKRATGAPPATMLPCAALVGARAADHETPVDGSYAVSIAAADLPASDRIPEAYGKWQVILDRGRFRLTHRSDAADWIADGTVRIGEDRMTWTVSDALDMGPHGAPDGLPLGAGQTLHFQWRRSGAQLDLRSLDPPSAMSAIGLRALRRTGDAPGQQRLVDPSPLLGIWTTTTTAHDVVAHHYDVTGIPDNTGPMRLTIGRSRCAWTQQAPNGRSFARGSCRFAGDTLELAWSVTDPHTAAAPYFFEWSVFHDRLTLRNSPGFSPEWTYHAWKRVS